LLPHREDKVFQIAGIGLNTRDFSNSENQWTNAGQKRVDLRSGLIEIRQEVVVKRRGTEHGGRIAGADADRLANLPEAAIDALPIEPDGIGHAACGQLRENSAGDVVQALHFPGEAIRGNAAAK
jgi:hypothetical protein